MDIGLFSKIVKHLEDYSIEDFAYVDSDGKIYGFKSVGDDSWEDEGKYQYKNEEGQLIEMNEDYDEIQTFNYGVSRNISRTGSYYTDYNYDDEPYEFFEIKEVLVPEVIIPAHTEDKWSKLEIDLENVVDEAEEDKKRIELEKIRLEEEIKAEKERLSKLYPMNKPEIIKMVNKNLKKRNAKFLIADMRKEYLDIVVAKKLESQEWIDYHRSLQEGSN